MTGLLHFLSLLRIRLAKPAHDRRTLQKRRLESILRAHGIRRSTANQISWQFFNSTKVNHHD